MANILSKIINIGITGAEKATTALKGIQDSLIKIKDNLKGVNNVKLDTKKVDNFNKALKSAPIEKFNNNVKDTSQSVDQLSSAMEGLGANLGPFNQIKAVFSSAKAGVSGLISSLGLLKGAIAATGIAAILIVLGLLVRAFSRSGEALETFEKVLTGFNFVLDKLTSDLIKFSKDVAKYIGTDLVNYFSKPKQVIIDFGNLIYDNIVSRFIGAKEAILSLGNVIGNILTGNFTKAGKAAVQLSEDIIKTYTGIDDVYGKINKGVEVVIEGVSSLKDAFSKGFSIQDQLIKINLELANFEKATAAATAEVLRAQSVLDNQSITFDTQLKNIDALTNAKSKQFNVEKNFNELNYKRIKLLIAINDESVRKEVDRTKLLNEIDIKRIELSTKSKDIQIENIKLINDAKNNQLTKDLQNAITSKDFFEKQINETLFSAKQNFEERKSIEEDLLITKRNILKQTIIAETKAQLELLQGAKFTDDEKRNQLQQFNAYKKEIESKATAEELDAYVKATKNKLETSRSGEIDLRDAIVKYTNETFTLKKETADKELDLQKEGYELTLKTQQQEQEISNKTRDTLLEIRETELETSKSRLDSAEKVIDKNKNLFQQVKQLKNLNKETIKQGEQEKGILNDKLDLQQDIINNEIDILKVKQSQNKLTDEEKVKLNGLEDDLSKLNSKREQGLNDIQKSTDEQIEARKAKVKAIIKEIQQTGAEVLSGIADIVNTIFEAGSANTERQLSILDNQLTKIEDRITSTNDLINESVNKTSSLQEKLNNTDERRQRGVQKQLDQELRRQNALIQIKIKDATAARGIQVQEAQLKREQAKADKDKALVGAIINTALAVSSAIASVPPPAGIILAAISAAAGAVSIATIASQPLPFIPDPPPLKFAEGGFTPRGDKNTEVGIVHAGEYVIPKNIVEDPDFRPIIDGLETKRLNGYAQGGLVQNPGYDKVNEILLTGLIQQNKDIINTINKSSERPIVVSVVDINSKQDEVRKIDVSSRL